MTAVSTLELEFWVEKADGTKELAATLRLIDTDLGFTATVTDMRLLIGLTQVNVSNVSVLSCTFGKLSALLIRTELNNGFRLFQSSINAFLARKTIPMPRNILGLFELTNLTLGYYDSYLYTGYTPVFMPPGEEAFGF
jgi:hypothetical protein